MENQVKNLNKTINTAATNAKNSIKVEVVKKAEEDSKKLNKIS